MGMVCEVALSDHGFYSETMFFPRMFLFKQEIQTPADVCWLSNRTQEHLLRATVFIVSAVQRRTNMIEKTKKQKKGSVSEEDISSLLQRYTATTVLALLQEVAQFPGVKLNWNALVKKTSTGISNAREYQMLWRHLAYRDVLLEKLEDGAEPLTFCLIACHSKV
ncbi:hypothetical protein QQP08_022623 [Theobroma cacao]|nr:hypothetical protein QQP08_022623 [Theobroma cacao]